MKHEHGWNAKCVLRQQWQVEFKVSETQDPYLPSILARRLPRLHLLKSELLKFFLRWSQWCAGCARAKVWGWWHIPTLCVSKHAFTYPRMSTYPGGFQNPYNQNPYNHNPYCVGILIGFVGILIGSVGILIGFVGILIGSVGILIGSDWLTLGCRDYDWCNLGWKISVGILIGRRDYDQS